MKKVAYPRDKLNKQQKPFSEAFSGFAMLREQFRKASSKAQEKTS